MMELKSVIDTISKEKKLEPQVVITAISHALEKVLKKSYPYGRVEVSADEHGVFKAYHLKK